MYLITSITVKYYCERRNEEENWKLVMKMNIYYKWAIMKYYEIMKKWKWKL